MTVEMLKGKIHRATVTQAELHYVGSITVDLDLLEAAGILEYEKVQVVDIDNGSRFETYTIAGARGSGMICLNGAAARCVSVGDKVILMAHDYQWTSVPDSYAGTTNTDSPVTPFASVYEALRDLTDPATGVADRSKLALQISFGSAGFHVDGEDRLLETTIYHPAPSTLALRLAQPDTQVVYSEEFRNPCALYTTEDGSRYKVWYENEQSVLDKVALARMFGITGVSLWRIGNIPADGAYDVWSALLTQR